MATRKTTRVPAKRSPGAMAKAKQVIGTVLGSDLVKVAAATALVGAAKALADRPTATLKGAASCIATLKRPWRGRGSGRDSRR